MCIYEKSLQSLGTVKRETDSTDEAWWVRGVAGDEIGQLRSWGLGGHGKSLHFYFDSMESH